MVIGFENGISDLVVFETKIRGLTYLSAETLGSLSSTGFSARTYMKVLK